MSAAARPSASGSPHRASPHRASPHKVSPRRIAYAIRWDLRLQLRHRILPVALAITAAYCVLLPALPPSVTDRLLVPLVFGDPVAIGFLFVGVMVLFERGYGTLRAVLVTPLRTAEYLWAKAVSLSLIAGMCCSAMEMAARGVHPGLLLFWATAVLTSLMLTFLGLSAVVRAASINAYLLLVPPCLMPLCIPLVGEFGLHSPALWLVPTNGSLYLFHSAVSGGDPLVGTLAAVYLAIATGAASLSARCGFDEHVRRRGG